MRKSNLSAKVDATGRRGGASVFEEVECDKNARLPIRSPFLALLI